MDEKDRFVKGFSLVKSSGVCSPYCAVSDIILLVLPPLQWILNQTVTT